MSGCLLTLDAGNTSLKGVLWEGERACVSFRLPWGAAPAGALASEIERAEAALGVAAPGIRPRVGWQLPPCRWVGEDLAAPGTVLYDVPADMGADRRVACWGARQACGPSLVVDCGTAVTLTHVDASGRLRGLAISAGYACLRRALGEAAPALAPLLPEPGRRREGLPRGSRDNLAVGIEQGWAGLLRGLVDDARDRLAGEGIDPGALLFTGTDGARAQRNIGRGMHRPGLLHLGLRMLAG